MVLIFLTTRKLSNQYAVHSISTWPLPKLTCIRRSTPSAHHGEVGLMSCHCSTTLAVEERQGVMVVAAYVVAVLGQIAISSDSLSEGMSVVSSCGRFWLCSSCSRISNLFLACSKSVGSMYSTHRGDAACRDCKRKETYE